MKAAKWLRALRTHSWLESWTTSYEGSLSIINGIFLDCEEQFRREREAVSHDPDWPYSVNTSHDVLMLNIRRNQKGAQLLLQVKEKYHPYVKARAKMPVTLPAVQDLWQEQLDELIAGYEQRKAVRGT